MNEKPEPFSDSYADQAALVPGLPVWVALGKGRQAKTLPGVVNGSHFRATLFWVDVTVMYTDLANTQHSMTTSVRPAQLRRRDESVARKPKEKEEEKLSVDQQARIKAMSGLMVQARHAHEDVGELLAAALHTAAEKLGHAADLVRGRPGSWEAEIILRMAETGGSGNMERIEQISALFVAMGEAGEDGGDVLSQAMSQAVDDLGGLDTFAGTSAWYHDLTNMGRQYSRYWDA